MFMEPPMSQHHDMLMGAVASSQHSGLENMLICSPKIAQLQRQDEEEEQKNNNNNNNGNSSKGSTGNNKPQTEQALKCPRCESTNTKFCYYNNYSLSQPRYFCKSCRRYWTQGGTLRNVPVGGGCRKNHKRPSSSISSKRPTNLPHVDPQFSVEATSIPPFINGFPMDLSLCQFGVNNNGMAIFPPQNQKSFDHPDHDLSFLGTLGLHGMFGSTESSSENVHAGFLDTIRNGLFNESQHNRSSFPHSYGETPGLCEEMGSAPKREMMTPDHHMEGENLVLWGFPWNGNISSKVADSARPGSSWNGINSAAANWQGIMNSPLM